MGPVFRHQHAAGTERALRRQRLLGGPEPARSTSTFWRTIMYAITGITGKVGGAVARNLLAVGLPVRAVLRDEAKAAEWRTRGCDIALAEMDDAASLTSDFRGAGGGF